MKEYLSALALGVAFLSCTPAMGQPQSQLQNNRGETQPYEVHTRGLAAYQDGSFNYQGHLEFNGQPANGDFFFEIHLLDSNGDEIDPRFAEVGPVTVTDGLFDMDIQIGGTPDEAEDFWRRYGPLAKKMRLMVSDVNNGSYTTLSPDIDLGATPHALFSRFAGGLKFPYIDSFIDVSGQPEIMMSLNSEFGGNVLVASVNRYANESIIRVLSQDPMLVNFGNQNGAIQIDARGRLVGTLSIADQYGIVGLISDNPSFNSAAALAQVDSGNTRSLALQAVNFNSNTEAKLGTQSSAGEFYGDVYFDDDTRTVGMPRRDYAFLSPSPVGPLAYASINFNGTKTSGTGNLSSSYDAASQQYTITVTGAALDFSTHSVNVTVVDSNEPRVATFNSFNDTITVKIWDINSGNVAVQDNFSIVIYDADPGMVQRARVPAGVDLDKYIEQTGTTPVITQPKQEPVPENKPMGIGRSSD